MIDRNDIRILTWTTCALFAALHQLVATSSCDVRLCLTLVQSRGPDEAAPQRPHGTCIGTAGSEMTP